jgi:hypothetical protein
MLGRRSDDRLAHFIEDAFLPADGGAATLELAVARSGELPRLPPVEWAREWVDRHQPVPLEVTYPYRIFLDRQVGIAYALDQRTGRGAVWVRRERELDLRSLITPFRMMLSWLANLFDGEVVHASAAVVDGQGWAMSGASGSGKSTLAIALGLAGDGFISDDCALLHGGRIHAVYSRAKLDARASELLGDHGLELRTLADAARAKSFFRVSDLGQGFVPSHELAAWAFPSISAGQGRYEMSARRAYQLLSTDSLREVLGGSARNRQRLAASVATRPAYRLLLGPNMAENVEIVHAAAAGVGAGHGR